MQKSLDRRAQYAHPALDRPLCCYESDTRAWLWAVIPCRKSPPVTAVHLRGRIHHPFLFPPSSFLPLSFLFLPPPSSLLSSFPSLLSSPLFLSLPPFPPSFSSPPSPPSLSLLSLPSLSFPFSFPSLSFPSLPSLLSFPPSSLLFLLLLAASGACGGLILRDQKVRRWSRNPLLFSPLSFPSLSLLPFLPFSPPLPLLLFSGVGFRRQVGA